MSGAAFGVGGGLASGVAPEVQAVLDRKAEKTDAAATEEKLQAQIDALAARVAALE